MEYPYIYQMVLLRLRWFITWFIIANSVKAQSPQLMLPVGHSSAVDQAIFVAGDRYAVTSSVVGRETKIWELPSGKLIKNFSIPMVFSPDGNRFVKRCSDTLEIWDMPTYSMDYRLMTGAPLSDITFTEDSKYLTGYDHDTLKFFNLQTGLQTQKLVGGDKYLISANSQLALMYQESPPCNPQLRNVQTGELISSLDVFRKIKSGFLPIVKQVQFSHDSRLILVNIWQMPGKMSKGGYTLSSEGGYSVLYVLDAYTGNLVCNIAFKDYVRASCISRNNKYLIVGDDKGGLQLLDITNGKKLLLTKLDNGITAIATAPMDSVFAAGTKKGDVYLISFQNFNQPEILIKHASWIHSIKFNDNGNQIIVGCNDKTASIWNVEQMHLTTELKGHCAEAKMLFLSPDGKYLGVVDDITYSSDKKKSVPGTISFRIWNCIKGIPIMSETAYLGNNFVFTGSSWGVSSYLYRGRYNGEDFVWQGNSGDAVIGSLGYMRIDYNTRASIHVSDKYTFMLFDSTDYLIFDKQGHFDGSHHARKLMYFVDGLNVVELEQVKDELWVPNLAERLMNGETIYSKTFNDINIYELAPIVKNVSVSSQEYRYHILPEKGGLGDCVVYINGIEVKRIKPELLNKNGDNLELVLQKNNLLPYFTDGEENAVVVKAFAADNSVSSRGAISKFVTPKTSKSQPNLYAVMVGISNYKGDALDLKYAAKDAKDISDVVGRAARKLLNTDGNEHVFIYNLTTDAERYSFPEKLGIKKVLEEIGSKAVSNDILLIFFAGHGLVAGDQKQFYFLTAEASGFTNLLDAGISTSELTEWMKPEKIKAQKRILIFDACNSGQAIKDFVKIGDDGQNYSASRSDSKSIQIKAIDKLNEKSGLFILSASASNQSAYEMEKYAQGLLTYALLQAIKENLDVLEDDRYLNVGRWFNAAERLVSELTKDNGTRQDPQIVSNTNFNIGLVDDEVISNIYLPMKKFMFESGNFQNSDETIADDDLELTRLINNQLQNPTSQIAEIKLMFIGTNINLEAYSLSGRYTVSGNTIRVVVNLKQNKTVIQKFELTGIKDELNHLAESIVQSALDLLEQQPTKKMGE